MLLNNKIVKDITIDKKYNYVIINLKQRKDLVRMAINVKYDVVSDYEVESIATVSKQGVYSKIFAGIFITILAYFVGLSMNFPQYIASEFMGIIIWFALIFGQYAMYGIINRNSAKGKSSLVPYTLYAVVEGLQLSFLITIFSVIYAGSAGLSTQDFNMVLLLVVTGVLIISVITGIVAARMPVTTKTLNFMASVNRIILITVISVGAMFMVSMIASLFGNTTLMNNFNNLYYGFGFAGIAFSVIFVIMASFGLLSAFYYVNVAQERGAKKQYEWLLATGVLANIVWLFIEVLKLVLKLLSNSRR